MEEDFITHGSMLFTFVIVDTVIHICS